MAMAGVAAVMVASCVLLERCRLLTRDARRYRQAFPGLQLITPE